MKFAVDTNFLVSATQWNYSVAHRLLEKLIQKNCEIFATKEILEEFKEILQRDFDYNSLEIESILEKVLHFLTLVIPQTPVNIVEKDPDDNKILECALEAKAKVILSYDKHLLDLKEFQNIKILRPEEAFGLI